MAVSPLATESYPAYSGNYSGPEARKNITEITVHHMAGKLTAASCGAIFQRQGRNGSSHYGIGYNGEIAWYVDENCVAWTNSNWPANQRAVTIECSNDGGAPDWHVSDATLQSVIKLVADIAKRNGLGKLVPKQNLTMHRQYTNTNCPGPYLESKFQYIADEANKINGQSPAPTPTPTPSGFAVGDKVTLKKWVDYNGTALKKTREYYFISQIAGNRAVLNADSVKGPIYAAANTNNLTKVGSGPTPAPTPAPSGGIKVGDRVRPIKFVDEKGTRLADVANYYVVYQLSGNRAVLKTPNGAIYAAMPKSNLRKV